MYLVRRYLIASYSSCIDFNYCCVTIYEHYFDIGLLAYQSMYSSQAVTAEGLFRASLDYFNKNQVVSIHDCRLRYEMAIVRGRQGLLLSKWDKRESEGQALVKSSEEAIATEYAKLSVTSDKRRIILTSMTLQIPL